MYQRPFFTVFTCAALALLAGCLETTQQGLSTNARGTYPRLALVASVSDNVVSTYWASAFAEPTSTQERLGWNATQAVQSFVREQIAPTGTKVTIAASHTSASAKATDAVLVLQQTPLNKVGQNYNPGRDLLALGGGLIGIIKVAGDEQNKDQLFQPRFVLWIRNPQANKSLIGENACTVGLTASLLDPASSGALEESVQVSGRSVIPGDLTAPNWGGLPKAEQKHVLSHCNLALRSAVSQALVKLNVAK